MKIKISTIIAMLELMPLAALGQTMVTQVQVKIGAKVKFTSSQECLERVANLKSVADDVQMLHGDAALVEVSDPGEFCAQFGQTPEEPNPTGKASSPFYTSACALEPGQRYAPALGGVYNDYYWKQHKFQVDGLQSASECRSFCESHLDQAKRSYCSYYKWQHNAQTGTICYLLRDVPDDAVVLQTGNAMSYFKEPMGGRCH